MDQNKKPMSWMSLPITTFSDLSYTVQVEAFDLNNLIFITDNGSGTVKLYMFDLSQM